MLSVIINVKNGSRYLEVCLNALQQFDDIVVLDNYSTDNTLEIAKRYSNVRIFQAEFTGMGNVRNLAASYAKNYWIFFVDCDEVVSRELSSKLLSFEFKNETVYSIFRRNYYAGKLVESSAWENDWVKRIYNRKETKYIDHIIHESVDTKGFNVEKIEDGHIYHFTYEKISELLDKTNFYSTLYAKQYLGRKNVNLFVVPLRGLAMFFKCYILKQGFRDGYEGLLISTYNAIGVVSKYFKLYELSHNRKIILLLKLKLSDNISEIINSINQQLLLPHEIHFIPDASIDLVAVKNILRENLVIKHQVLQDNSDFDAINEEMSLKIILDDNHSLKNKKFLAVCRKSFYKAKNIPKVKFLHS